MPSFRLDLVGLDDHVMIVEDQAFNRDPANLLGAFSSNFYDTYYRPLHRITFVVDALRAGTAVAAYHRTNVLLHVVATLTLFATFLVLGYARATAAVFGLVFAVHPALTSAVAWIPGRDNVLVTIFLLASLAAWARHLDSHRPGPLVLHWLLLAAALFTKEAAVSFPAVAFAFAVLWHGEPLRSRRLGVAAFGWGACLVLYLALRAAMLPAGKGWESLGLDALARSWPVVFAMVGKLVLPIRLTAFANLDALSVATGVAAVVAAALAVARSRQARVGHVLFGAAWFAILLAPTLVQRTGLYDYGEYRLYWLAFGLLVVVAEILRALAVDLRRPAALGGVALVCVAFAARTLAYQRVFDGPSSFWTQMVELDPGSGWGWFHVGRTHYTDGDLEAALAAYERARAAGFERVDLYVDLSAVQLDRQAWPAALDAARRAVEIEPGNPYAQSNLGSARMHASDFAGAVEAFRAALDPRAAEHFRYADRREQAAFRARVHEQLGTCRHALGETAAAERDWTTAIHLDPKRYGAYQKLIEVQLAHGQVARARELAAELARQGGRLPRALRTRLQLGAAEGEAQQGRAAGGP